MLFCHHCQIFKTIIYSVGHEIIYFEKYLLTAASENLSDAAILIFRRFFRSSVLLAFCKISVLKTSVKFLGKHLCWILFSINLQTLSQDYITDVFQWKRFILKTPFQQQKQSFAGVLKKGVLRNFAKFTRKHLCRRPATLLKKTLWHRCFPVNFAKFLRTPFFTEHLWWLLL